MPVAVTLQAGLRGNLSVYPVAAMAELGVDAFVTDRFGGVSAAPYDSLNLARHVGDEEANVRENRRRVARAAGVDPERLAIVRQVHGDTVLDASDADDGAEGDGLVTSSPEVALVMLVADCVPVLLVDASSTRVAVVHAGWRGLDRRVIEAAVGRFDDPTNLHAFLGPAITLEGYQVGPEVAARFARVPGAVRADVADRSRLDLRRVAAHQLSELGVADERIIVCTQATDGGETFYSDRAQRPTGRFALVAKRAP